MRVSWLYIGIGIVAGFSFLPGAPRHVHATTVDSAVRVDTVALAEAIQWVEEGAWRRAIRVLDRIVDAEPENLTAYYYRGIAHREDNAATSKQQASTADFEFILARDSLFRDVLYQYALAQRYLVDGLPRAIELCEAQTRLRPELDKPKQDLFNLYRYYVRTTPAERAQNFLGEIASEYAEYGRAEVLRRQGQRKEADRIYGQMIRRSLAMPFQPILLSRARIYYAQNQPRIAEAFVQQAISTIDSPLAANLIFRDFQYIVTAEEWDTYQALTDAEAYQMFFNALWARRNPMPAAAVNVRLQEHYRRLAKAETDYIYTAIRSWQNDGDQARELEYPVTHALGLEFDDRGLVYIRHGDPDDTALYTSPSITAESWHYESPLMDFHFEQSGVGNQRFRPVPHEALLGTRTNPGDILQWNTAYMGYWKEGTLDNRAEMVRVSRSSLALGLTSDRHTWSSSFRALNMPYLVSASRGEEGATRLDIYYALPLGGLSADYGDEVERIEVEVGLSLHDAVWQPEGRHAEIKRMQPHPNPTVAAVDVLSFNVPPGGYNIGLYGRALQSNRLSAYRFGYEAPDFTTATLNMSDLVLAYNVVPSTQPHRLNRGGLLVQANPLGRVALDESLYAYFEVYNLTFDANDQANYSIRYTVTREGRSFLGLGGRKREALSVEVEQVGSETAPVEYLEIDLSAVRPGSYTLTVTITDQQTGASVSRTRPIEITK